jgi:hypothetical protein
MMLAPRGTSRNAEVELVDWLAECYADPLRFVEEGYDWPIKGEESPDRWQSNVLVELGRAVEARGFDGVNAVLPIREAVSSGHGIGKSVLIAWIVDWLMSTRRNAIGTVTANTNDQLEKKTWAAIREWTARCITAHWFEINSQIMYRKGFRATWFCSPQSCAEENSEAFAGQHAKDSTSFYLFDEASAVPPSIHEVAEGGLTDGEPFFLMFGNMTRNTGKFHEAVFGTRRDRWTSHVIDSRDCKFSNKALIAEWADDYGEDSDFFRVRVLGLPPKANELQYIDLDRVQAAQKRVPDVLADEPLICGVDVSGGGSAWTVARFRRGQDGRSIQPIRISGEKSRDRGHIVSTLAEALNSLHEGQPIAAMFIDMAFGAAVVERLRAMGHLNVFEVNFGGESPEPRKDVNLRAFMYRKCKEWLPTGAIPKTDVRLETDLTGPGFHLDKKNRLVLESKESMQKRGVASPDDSDGLVLTWASPVKVRFAGSSAGWAPEASTYQG